VWEEARAATVSLSCAPPCASSFTSWKDKRTVAVVDSDDECDAITPYSGITFNERRRTWHAWVILGGTGTGSSKRRLRLGAYSDDVSAAAARDAAVVKYRLNRRRNFTTMPPRGIDTSPKLFGSRGGTLRVGTQVVAPVRVGSARESRGYLESASTHEVAEWERRRAVVTSIDTATQTASVWFHDNGAAARSIAARWIALELPRSEPVPASDIDEDSARASSHAGVYWRRYAAAQKSSHWAIRVKVKSVKRDGSLLSVWRYFGSYESEIAAARAHDAYVVQHPHRLAGETALHFPDDVATTIAAAVLAKLVTSVEAAAERALQKSRRNDVARTVRAWLSETPAPEEKRAPIATPAWTSLSEDARLTSLLACLSPASATPNVDAVVSEVVGSLVMRVERAHRRDARSSSLANAVGDAPALASREARPKAVPSRWWICRSLNEVAELLGERSEEYCPAGTSAAALLNALKRATPSQASAFQDAPEAFWRVTQKTQSGKIVASGLRFVSSESGDVVDVDDVILERVQRGTGQRRWYSLWRFRRAAEPAVSPPLPTEEEEEEESSEEENPEESDDGDEETKRRNYRCRSFKQLADLLNENESLHPHGVNIETFLRVLRLAAPRPSSAFQRDSEAFWRTTKATASGKVIAYGLHFTDDGGSGNVVRVGTVALHRSQRGTGERRWYSEWVVASDGAPLHPPDEKEEEEEERDSSEKKKKKKTPGRFACRSLTEVLAHLTAHEEYCPPGLTPEDFVGVLRAATPSSGSDFQDAHRAFWSDIDWRASGKVVASGLHFDTDAGGTCVEEVSVLLCTVTFYANLAHSLTRSP
jgi:hypothetical protein